MLHAGRSLLLLRNADNKLSAPPRVNYYRVNPKGSIKMVLKANYEGKPTSSP